LPTIIKFMKFMVSDNMELEHGFGKWRYSHDAGVRRWTDGERVCLYFGYTIEGSIEQLVSGDPALVPQGNGKFCVVMMWRDRLEVHVDYFCQSKVYYQTRDGLTVTNHLPLLPLRDEDVDTDMVEHFARQIYRASDGLAFYNGALQEWKRFSTDHTLFRDVASVPRDHMLAHRGDDTRVVRVHDTRLANLQALGSTLDWSSSRLEDRVHNCMEQHGRVIRANFGNICSSVSEGIDSTLQDQYLPGDHTRLMYHPEVRFREWGQDRPLEHKARTVELYRQRGARVEVQRMPVDEIGAITDGNISDVMLSYLDTVPTVWQVRALGQRPDVLLYGQCADEMFMHLPKYLYARIPAAQRPSYHTRYGGRKFGLVPGEGIDPYDGGWARGGWREAFSHMAVPNLYNRDVESQTNVLTASLYADRRIFNLVHRMPRQVMLSSMADAGPQRAILREHFGWDFQTAHKDGAGFECDTILKTLLRHTLKQCLRDHCL